jgi:hypothetical protein
VLETVSLQSIILTWFSAGAACRYWKAFTQVLHLVKAIRERSHDWFQRENVSLSRKILIDRSFRASRLLSRISRIWNVSESVRAKKQSIADRNRAFSRELHARSMWVNSIYVDYAESRENPRFFFQPGFECYMIHSFRPPSQCGFHSVSGERNVGVSRGSKAYAHAPRTQS